MTRLTKKVISADRVLSQQLRALHASSVIVTVFGVTCFPALYELGIGDYFN